MPNIIDSRSGGEVLHGTADQDIFRYDSLDDSRLDDPDDILDFQVGIDTVDISAVDGGRVSIYEIDNLREPGVFTYLYFGDDGAGGYADWIIGNFFLLPLSDIRLNARTGVTFHGADGGQTLQGTPNADVLIGGYPNSYIQAAGTDTFVGGAGADQIYRGGHQARYVYTSLDDTRVGAEDFIHGFVSTGQANRNNDRIDISAVAGPIVFLSLSDTATALSFAVDEHFTYQDRLFVDRPISLQSDSGHTSDLVFNFGTALVEVASGQGSFRLDGEEQNDILVGSHGADTLSGAGGDDQLSGGDGADVLMGGAGADVLSGGPGADRFVYTSVYESTTAADFEDVIVDFQHGTDLIDLTGVAGTAVNLFHSEDGATSVFFAFHASGAGAAIYVRGDVEAGDVIAPGATLVLTGSQQADVLHGADGNDVLVGRGGADVLYGGGGSDTFSYQALSDSTPQAYDVLADFAHGEDKIDLSAVSGGLVGLYHDGAGDVGVAYGFSSGAFRGAISVPGDVEGDDLITAPGAALYISGSGLSETLVGGAGADTILGAGGNDILQGGGGADILTGGRGADTFRIAAVSDSTPGAPDTITDFLSGADRLELGAVAGPFINLAFDGAGHTTVYYAFGSSGGAAGEVYVSGTVQATDVVAPAGIAFYLSGSSAGETLVGGGVDDTFVGGGGRDILYGGQGNDVFRYVAVSDSTPSAPDYIADFQHEQDLIDLTGVAGGFVNIVHGSGGTSQVYFAATNGVAGGAISVFGDVEDDDILADARTVFIDTGAYTPGPAAGEMGGPHFGAPALHGHVYLA